MENKEIKYTPQASVQASNIGSKAKVLNEQTKFNASYESGIHNDLAVYEQLKLQFEKLQNTAIALGEMAQFDAQDALTHISMHSELNKS